MTTPTITATTKVTILKHLASGKGLDVVATIVGLKRDQVLDVASSHGYPDKDKLAWAVDVLEKKIEDEAALPDRTNEVRRDQRRVTMADQPTTTPTPLTKPDEIRVLLNTAKGHESKRIQNAANKVIDDLDRLRALIRDDQEKHAARRKSDAEKAAARAEIERLEAQLREAKAKLRKSPHQQPGGQAAVRSGQIERARTLGQAALLSNVDLEPHGLTSKDLRTWAQQHDVDVPAAGRLPRRILDVYLARQDKTAS